MLYFVWHVFVVISIASLGKAYQVTACVDPAVGIFPNKTEMSTGMKKTLEFVNAINKDNEKEIGDMYNKWEADTYDEHMADLHFQGPNMLAAKLQYYFHDDKQCHILDVGCGTGAVALELAKLGYTNIDGVDASAGLLEKANKLKLYKNTVLAYVGDNPIPLPDESYDAVIGSAILNVGHIPPSAIIDLYRLLKPGGILMMLNNSEVWNTIPQFHIDLKGEIDKLVDEKKLRRLEWSLMDDYVCMGKQFPGLFFAYKKM